MPIATLFLYSEARTLRIQNGIDDVFHVGGDSCFRRFEFIAKYSPVCDFALGGFILSMGVASLFFFSPAVGYTFIGLGTLYAITTGIVWGYLNYREHQEREQESANLNRLVHDSYAIEDAEN